MTAAFTVLYAEDDENDAYFMQRAFAKRERTEQLRVVPNGRAVIDYLTGVGEYADRAAFPWPKVVMLDVKMPETSGLEALTWIRARRDFDDLVVVMFTSSTQKSDVEFSRTHGANGYLVKPSNAGNLCRLIEEIQRASAAVSPSAPRLALESNQL